MLDTLQIIFWSITYILIILSGVQNVHDRKAAIPGLAVIQNLAWETTALIYSHGFWGHILWFLLDLIIFFLALYFVFPRKSRFVLYILGTILLCISFYDVFSRQNGMLYSSFIIDLLMAIYYLIERKALSPKLKVPIAFTKLAGDIFAGFHYAPQSKFVAILAGAVFLCNLYYLYLCLEEQPDPSQNKNKRQ